MMPAPYTVTTFDGESWFVHILQYTVAEASSFSGVCERTVERCISKFLLNDDVKPEPVGSLYGSISLAPREELVFFA